MQPTLTSATDPVLSAIAAYLAGDLAGVQAAFAPITGLLDDVLASVPPSSSACSPFETDDTIVAAVTLVSAQ